MKEKAVDIQEANRISGGFQVLHAVYVVERFLENLVKRHCQFHIAFFDGEHSIIFFVYHNLTS